MVDQTATSGQIGAGQQDPFDSNSEFSVQAFIVRQIMADLETMIPVQVVKVKPGSGTPPAGGTVDVQILVSQVDGASNVSKPGVVSGIPYFRTQGGDWAIVCDPVAKDFGFIVSASRDTSNVNKKPGIQVPGSKRKYSYSDSYYVGGVLNGSPKAYIWLKADGTFTLVDKAGNMIQTTTGTGISITPASGQPLTVNGALVVTGNLQLQGSIESQTGGIYGGNIVTTGSVTGSDMIANPGGSQVTLKAHIHPSNGSPPTPGH